MTISTSASRSGYNRKGYELQCQTIEDLLPCKTVTSDDSFASRGIVKRKFSIGDLKRICAFPDDFILIGNSVPPLMMKAIAETVRDKILIGV